MCYAVYVCIAAYKKIYAIMGLPGFEPGLVDSESTVLAITPQALLLV